MSRERPILFSSSMVRALLAGTKTQTRRVVKNSKCPDTGCDLSPGELAQEPQHVIERSSPHGVPGDRLWVRETWSKAASIHCSDLFYRADGENQYGRQHPLSYVEREKRWRPSIHMPRWASRISLQVTGVRVEQLQDIREADAIAEGIAPNWIGEGEGLKKGPNGFGGEGWVEECGWMNYMTSMDGEPCYTPKESFRSLWESINGADSWAANPWVRVVEFKPVTP